MENSESILCGSVGHKIMVKDKEFFIGDVVLLTDTKSNVSAYYQIIWNDFDYQVVLENETNRLSAHPNGDCWFNRAYITLHEVANGRIPYVRIERVGNSHKDLKKIKRIKLNKLKRN